ncbi:MAG: hypothetical protein J0I06_13325 [Planctomycetes bacterium]|nr:hypothetical protein [Planctomycetota bacterium]
MSCLSVLVAVMAAVPSPAARTGSLTVYRPAMDEEPLVVTVSLYRNGELVRTRELLPYRPPLLLSGTGLIGGAELPKPRDRSSVTWNHLPEGTYDIHFEAKGFAGSVKRARVTPEDGDQLEIIVELDKEGSPKKGKNAERGRR